MYFLRENDAGSSAYTDSIHSMSISLKKKKKNPKPAFPVLMGKQIVIAQTAIENNTEQKDYEEYLGSVIIAFTPSLRNSYQV